MVFLACEKNHNRDLKPRGLGRPPKHWQAVAGGSTCQEEAGKKAETEYRVHTQVTKWVAGAQLTEGQRGEQRIIKTLDGKQLPIGSRGWGRGREQGSAPHGGVHN